MSKEQETQHLEQQIKMLAKKTEKLNDAVNIAYNKLYETKCAQELIALAPQVLHINNKLQKRKKWGRIPQILIPFIVVYIGYLIGDRSFNIGVGAFDVAGIGLLEMITDAIISDTSFKENDILSREQQLLEIVPDSLRIKTPSQLQAMEKRYDIEFERISKQIRETETLKNSALAYLRSFNAYNKMLELMETLENKPNFQLLKSIEEKINSLDLKQLNCIEKATLQTLLENEWNAYISESITIENLPTQEDLIYKPAKEVYEHPITLHLVNKGNQDSK